MSKRNDLIHMCAGVNVVRIGIRCLFGRCFPGSGDPHPLILITYPHEHTPNNLRARRSDVIVSDTHLMGI